MKIKESLNCEIHVNDMNCTVSSMYLFAIHHLIQNVSLPNCAILITIQDSLLHNSHRQHYVVHSLTYHKYLSIARGFVI